MKRQMKLIEAMYLSKVAHFNRTRKNSIIDPTVTEARFYLEFERKHNDGQMFVGTSLRVIRISSEEDMEYCNLDEVLEDIQKYRVSDKFFAVLYPLGMYWDDDIVIEVNSRTKIDSVTNKEKIVKERRFYWPFGKD